jgi:hypothetical protein
MTYPSSLSQPSWPGLSQPSALRRMCADGWDKPGHDGFSGTGIGQ